MAFSSRRVVLTGLGILNPLGQNTTAFWESLSQSRNGIRRIQSFDVSALPCQIGGEIVDFDPKNYIDKKDRKSLRVMARAIQLCVCASQLAINDGHVDKQQIDPARFGVEFGACLMPSELQELGPASQVCSTATPGKIDLGRWGCEGISLIPPLWMLKYLPNMPACHVSILHNAQGPNNTIIEGDVASLLALGEAYHIIARDQADIFLAGGADSKMNPLSLVRQLLFNQLSCRNDAPDQACRPFERRRDGMVLGEGAAVLMVEELEHARRRGARIYAEMAGFAAAFDRDRKGAGLARAIRLALAEAGITPADVDHVNAHGLGVQGADEWEANALHEVFGSCRPAVPVFAAKSYFGNLGSGGGTSELAASLLALEHGQLPATRNYQEADPACPVLVAATARPISKRHVVKLGFTQMGHCAAVVCRKWE